MNIDTKYLLDAVSIRKLSTDILKLDFIKANCIIPEEILYEVNSDKKKELLLPFSEKPTTQLIIMTENLLDNIGINNKVLDLYNNEGNGDIILIATILCKKDEQALTMFKTNWVLVTDDNELIKLATTKKIECISTEEFINLATQ